MKLIRGNSIIFEDRKEDIQDTLVFQEILTENTRKMLHKMIICPLW